MLPLTPSEEEVIRLLKEKRVAPRALLSEKLKVAPRTVSRALKKYGPYSSLNLNSTYLTLKDLPQFDSQGLWSYGKALFSRCETVTPTVKALVESSCSGPTVLELETLLRTRVHNSLSWLIRSKELDRFYLGRHTVYVSSDAELAAPQEAQRRQEQAAGRGAPAPPLPPGLDPLTVVRVLVQLLRTPQESFASLAKSLRREGVLLQAQQVQQMIEFYHLEKKPER